MEAVVVVAVSASVVVAVAVVDLYCLSPDICPPGPSPRLQNNYFLGKADFELLVVFPPMRFKWLFLYCILELEIHINQ